MALVDKQIMLTEEYISFDHISIDQDAAHFEATLYEPDDFIEPSEPTPLNTTQSPKPSIVPNTSKDHAQEDHAQEDHSVENHASANRPLRSKIEAADATTRLATHMRQLSRGLKLGRSGQIHTAQQTNPSTTLPLTNSTENQNPNPLTPGYIESGCPGLERLLPGGGYEPGCLVEWFHSGIGGAAGSLAMLSAIPAMRDGKALVIIDWNHTFYPPAAAALGADLKRIVVVRPKSREDGWWSLDQALRCTAVGSVWCELPDEMDDRLARRLQLAAETGGTLGMLIRNSRTRNQPSWADVQWQVRTTSHLQFATSSNSHNTPTSHNAPTTPHSGRYVQVDLVRCRSGAGHGGYKRQSIWLELGHPVRPPLPQSIFTSPHEPIRSSVKTTWIREATPPFAPPKSTDPTSKQGHMRNDSYGGTHTSSYTQRMAAQLAMPTRTPTAATTANNGHSRTGTNSHNATPTSTSATRAVSA